MMSLSQRYWAGKVTFTFGGQTFRCTRRTRGALIELNNTIKTKHPNALGVGRPAHLTVLQGCYQDPRHVPASAGTHDFDAVLDIWIHGLSGDVGQATCRAKGWAAFWRKPSQGPWVEHIHMALLPPGIKVPHPAPQQVGAAYQGRGLKVGRFIDGGLTSQGTTNATSQITDYMADPPRDALTDHRLDSSWHPADIAKTVYRPKGY